MVMQYADQLCPGEWRVPTKEEYCLIHNGSKTNCNDTNTTFNGKLGFTYSGYAQARTASVSDLGRYWSSTDFDATRAYYFNFGTNITHGAPVIDKFMGYALRCVQ
jgi:uncharacterized protein (TIGR02145 family)